MSNELWNSTIVTISNLMNMTLAVETAYLERNNRIWSVLAVEPCKEKVDSEGNHQFVASSDGLHLLYQAVIPASVHPWLNEIIVDAPEDYVDDTSEELLNRMVNPDSSALEDITYDQTDNVRDPFIGNNCVGPQLKSTMENNTWISFPTSSTLPVLSLLVPMGLTVRPKDIVSVKAGGKGSIVSEEVNKCHPHYMATAHLNKRKLFAEERILGDDGLMALMVRQQPNLTFNAVKVDIHVHGLHSLPDNEENSDHNLPIEDPFPLECNAEKINDGREVARNLATKDVLNLWESFQFEQKTLSEINVELETLSATYGSRVAATLSFMKWLKWFSKEYNHLKTLGDHVRLFHCLNKLLGKANNDWKWPVPTKISYYPFQCRILFKALTGGTVAISFTEGQARMAAYLSTTNRMRPPQTFLDLFNEGNSPLPVPNYNFLGAPLSTHLILHPFSANEESLKFPYEKFILDYQTCSQTAQSQTENSSRENVLEWVLTYTTNLCNNLWKIDELEDPLIPFELQLKNETVITKAQVKEKHKEWLQLRNNHLLEKLLGEKEGVLKTIWKEDILTNKKMKDVPPLQYFLKEMGLSNNFNSKQAMQQHLIVAITSLISLSVFWSKKNLGLSRSHSVFKDFVRLNGKPHDVPKKTTHCYYLEPTFVTELRNTSPEAVDEDYKEELEKSYKVCFFWPIPLVTFLPF
jgi:hypothetical protein